MGSNKNNSIEIIRMQIADINQALEILTENKLEFWSYKDFLSEIQYENSIVLVGKLMTEVIVFCVARLIKLQLNSIEFNCKKTINNYIPKSYTHNLITIDSKKQFREEDFESECEIYNIAVKKEFQNRGIGKQMLDKLVLMIKEYNSQAIWLEVRDSNRIGIHFYQKNNFRQIYIRKNFYSNPLENAIVMKRDLL